MATRAAKVLVVDASVATKWHLTDEEHSDVATLIIEDFARGRLDLIAPEHIRFEVPSAITTATLGRKPRITVEQGEEAIAEFLALGIRTVRDSELILAAYSLVHHYGCALYDALYLALAQRLGAEFITADSKLYRVIADIPNAVWIGDYGVTEEQ